MILVPAFVGLSYGAEGHRCRSTGSRRPFDPSLDCSIDAVDSTNPAPTASAGSLAITSVDCEVTHLVAGAHLIAMGIRMRLNSRLRTPSVGVVWR
ncbi:hypothetical protein K523DRAFT_129923 [Schizophyllum commune Tattone D]|nr:hypothetical protein K523DRAFT_129923 [Schizophyllum commune Tattone D]